MKKILEVARRDYIETVKTKTFLIGVLILPVLMAVGMIVPAKLMKKSFEGPMEDRHLAVLNLAEQITPELISAFTDYNKSNPQRKIIPELHKSASGKTDNKAQELKEKVRSGELDGFLLIEPEVVEGEGRGYLYTKSMSDFEFSHRVVRLLNNAVTNSRYRLNGLSPELIGRLGRWVSVEDVDLSAEKEKARDKIAMTMVPFFFMFLLFFGIFATSQGLMMSVIEEKSSRVIEVLLAAVSPFQLMAGKILGQTAVGLTLVVLYATGAIMVAARYGMADLLTGGLLAYFLVYFILGFLLIAGFLAAVGSTCNEIKEAQNLMGPVMLILMVPFFTWMYLVQHPTGTLAVVLSYIPPITPMVMILRIAARPDLPLLEIIASLLLAVSVPAVMWAAAKVFRTGVLMYGKSPTPRELLRWLRYG
ncbi:MAG: ABC transporter permease [Candidatus Glassbacteria bacterium]|nr:ABC transporter permease [Candidatus Glassbacteria bacterium]